MFYVLHFIFYILYPLYLFFIFLLDIYPPFVYVPIYFVSVTDLFLCAIMM